MVPAAQDTERRPRSSIIRPSVTLATRGVAWACEGMTVPGRYRVSARVRPATRRRERDSPTYCPSGRCSLMPYQGNRLEALRDVGRPAGGLVVGGNKLVWRTNVNGHGEKVGGAAPTRREGGFPVSGLRFRTGRVVPQMRSDDAAVRLPEIDGRLCRAVGKALPCQRVEPVCRRLAISLDQVLTLLQGVMLQISTQQHEERASLMDAVSRARPAGARASVALGQALGICFPPVVN